MPDLFPELLVEPANAWITSAIKSAELEGDYRWLLSRVWNAALPRACWNCLNPSDADHQVNDPSLIQMMKWRYYILHTHNKMWYAGAAA